MIDLLPWQLWHSRVRHKWSVCVIVFRVSSLALPSSSRSDGAQTDKKKLVWIIRTEQMFFVTWFGIGNDRWCGIFRTWVRRWCLSPHDTHTPSNSRMYFSPNLSLQLFGAQQMYAVDSAINLHQFIMNAHKRQSTLTRSLTHSRIQTPIRWRVRRIDDCSKRQCARAHTQTHTHRTENN